MINQLEKQILKIESESQNQIDNLHFKNQTILSLNEEYQREISMLNVSSFLI